MLSNKMKHINRFICQIYKEAIYKKKMTKKYYVILRGKDV